MIERVSAKNWEFWTSVLSLFGETDVSDEAVRAWISGCLGGMGTAMAAALVHCGGDLNLATHGPDESLQGPKSTGASGEEDALAKPASAEESDGSGRVQDTAQVDAVGGAGGSYPAPNGPPGAGGTMKRNRRRW